MPCVAPIVVVHPDTKLRSEVACGQCRTCRLRRKLGWVGRLTLENREHKFSRFITLTYAKDPGVLDYRDFQLFMKRYRKEFGDVRFFVVGEYGGKSGRGHYHAILFGHPPRAVGHSKDLPLVWDHGFCYDGTVTRKSIGYVAGYVFKENYTPSKLPFVRMSLKPGIGMEGIRRQAEAVAELSKFKALTWSTWPRSYSIGGKEYPLCQGGLAKFIDVYLESGGLPPTISNPIARDLRVVGRASPLGRGAPVLSMESVGSFNLQKRYEDVQAIKKER